MTTKKQTRVNWWCIVFVGVFMLNAQPNAMAQTTSNAVANATQDLKSFVAFAAALDVLCAIALG